MHVLVWSPQLRGPAGPGATHDRATVPDSTLRVEINNLEEQADNAKARELFWKPLSWLGAIRPTSANDAFDPALWETFVSTTLGLELTEVQPRRTTGW